MSLRGLPLMLAALAVPVLAVPAVARPVMAPARPAPELRPGGWGYLSPVSEPAALKAMHRFAGCLAAKRPREVRETLQLDYTSPDYQAHMHALSQGSSCAAPGKLRMNGLLFAGSLAEAAFLADHGREPVSRLLPADWASKPPLTTHNEVDVMAYCTVQKAAQGVRELLDTQPASAAEDSALRAIGPVLPLCVSQGTQARFNKPGLRAQLALALYRAVDHFRSA